MILGWATLALASEGAESERLAEELVRLAERNTWAGVDRTYRALVALGTPIKPTEHLLGGQAALALGDPLLARYRLRRVPAPAPGLSADQLAATEYALAEAGNIESRYGKVALCVGPERLPLLVRPQMPFAQAERDAINRVAEALRDQSRCHRGLLPTGEYELDGQPFTVVAGEAWVVMDIGWK